MNAGGRSESHGQIRAHHRRCAPARWNERQSHACQRPLVLVVSEVLPWVCFSMTRTRVSRPWPAPTKGGYVGADEVCPAQVGIGIGWPLLFPASRSPDRHSLIRLLTISATRGKVSRKGMESAIETISSKSFRFSVPPICFMKFIIAACPPCVENKQDEYQELECGICHCRRLQSGRSRPDGLGRREVSLARYVRVSKRKSVRIA
jgi:hypothetical protein